MHARHLFATLVLLCTVAASALAGKNEKPRPDPSPLPLWSAKGTVLINRQYIPGLNAALLLTDPQIISLYEAWRETVDSPELLEKGKAVKLNPNSTEEERQEVRSLYEAAHGRLQSRVARILTLAQKELMVTIDVLYAQAREKVDLDLAPEYALVKANAQEGPRVAKLAEERLASEFLERLSTILTAEQFTALRKSAAEEQRREAEAAAQKK